MKSLISILIVVGLAYAGWKGFEYREQVNKQEAAQERAAEATQIDPRQLPGMAPDFELSLEKACQGGARTLKTWLKDHKDSPRVKDPRLAWIELDYVMKVAQEDPMEAKKVFAAVKLRVPVDSPVYPRIRQLEKTFE